MIQIKDVDNFRNLILKHGDNFSSFSKKMKVTRSCLDKIFARKSISPKNAKKVLEILNVDFETLFFIT